MFASYFLADKAIFGCYPSPERTELLKELGVKYFVDLTVPGEVRQVYTNVPNYINYPIPDRRVPTDDTTFASLILRVSNTIGSLEPGEKLYIHCRGGHGRSGVVVAILLKMLYPSLTTFEAISETTLFHNQRTEMRQKWRDMGSPQTKHQKSYVHRFFCPLAFFRAYRRGPTSGFSICSAHEVVVPKGLSLWVPFGTFGSAAAAFEASRKPLDRSYVNRHMHSKNPRMARKLGERTKPVLGWEQARDSILELIIHLKMQQHSGVFANLVATGCRPLQYKCRNGDFLGLYQNALGKCLEKLRDRHLFENSIRFVPLIRTQSVQVFR